MTDSQTPAVQRYKFVQYGGGVEELDRFGVRDRIRAGDITAYTELAIVDTDDWRPASAFPELGRYFEMAATAPRTMPGSPVVPRSPARPMETMGSRVLNGLTYPLAGGEALLLVGLAVFSIFPVLGLLSTLASTVIMVEIVRTSADGRTKMPLVDTSQAWELMRTYLQVLFVTIVSLSPVILFGGFAVVQAFRGALSVPMLLTGLIVASAVAAIYYPACLATIAVWDSILDSLNPVYVFSVIRKIGADYFIVVLMWFITTTLTTIASSPWVSPFVMIPVIGGIMKSFLSFWALFYVSHLLGYAVYRHSRALGWE